MCPDDGAERGGGEPRLVPDGGRPASGNEECGSCGELIEAGTTYCPHCGTHERDRGSGGDGSDADGSDSSGGSSRRTATVTRRDDEGDSDSSSGGRSSRSTSNFAGGKSGRKGFDERRQNRDSGGEDDTGRGGSGGRGDRSGRSEGSGGRGDRSGRSEGSGGRGNRSGRSEGSNGHSNRGGEGSARPSESSGRSERGGRESDRGGRGRSETGSGGGGRRMPDDDEEFCAACGEIIDASASVCPSCGDEREVASASSSSGGASAGNSAASSPSDAGGGSSSGRESGGSARGGGSASESSPSTSTSLNNPTVNGWRWKIGWQPKKIIVGLTILGAIVGAMLDYIGQFAFFGLVVGVLVWFWGRGEVNAKYMSLIQDFRDETRSKVERETGGMALSSAHTFIGGHGSSPLFIEPSKKYKTSHLLFGDTSVVINRQYHYKMPGRDTTQGGKQQEVFYDQISNVQSEDFANYAELQISLSSGQTERIKGRDTSGINAVKRDLQQKMRDARR